MFKFLGITCFLLFLTTLIISINPKWIARGKEPMKRSRILFGSLVMFALFVTFANLDSGDTTTPSTPTTASVEPQKQEDVKLSDTDKVLLKGSYANFDDTQRVQFEGITKTYDKLTDADKSEVKTDFERLNAEKEVVIAKVLEESLKKAREEEAARKASEVAVLKAESKTIPYKDIARNPDNYKDAKVKYTGQVIQVQESGNDVGLRVNITKGDYGLYTDTVYVMFDNKIVSGRVLDDDIITFYGTSSGLLTYKTVMGSEMTIPQIKATIVEIHQ